MLGSNKEASAALVTTPPADEELNLKQLAREVDKLRSKDSYDPALSRIYRYTPIPTVVLDPSWCIVEVSNSHLAFSGQSRDDLVHACISDLPPHAIPVPDIATIYGALHAAVATKDIQTVEDIHCSEIGAFFRLRVIPVFDESELLYIILEANNITMDHLHAADHQHAYVNETYKILVDTVKDYAIFMLDTKGNIVTWNSGAAILKGYTGPEIIGRHFSVFYGPEDRRNGKPGRGLAVCLREGKMEDEGWRYRQDGSRFWANVMITPIYQFGRHVGFVKVTRDLTERKAAEARMIAAFEESSKMKTDFLANMSHEIRTPMNGMLLALTMLTGTELTDQQREYAAIMEDSTSILLQVINDVLDYSKLSSGSFSLNSDVVKVETIVDAVVRNCRSGLNPDVELTCSFQPGFPTNLQGDPLRFRQVLQNLLGNAVKFTEKGYIKLSLLYTAVEDDDTDTKDKTSDDSDNEKTPSAYCIRTEVTDSGVGVPDTAINTLFTPFTRFADASMRHYQGTGLGLSICKSLAELMNGTVGYQPNPEGPGSMFWFTATMTAIEPSASGKLERPNPRPPLSDGADLTAAIREIAPRKHILLVEDNLVNHMVMLKLLQSFGFERIDAAWDGAEAVRLIQQTPLSFNAVLMDINMPVMDGMEATSRIRRINADVPIIALTGNALKGDAELYLAKGMNDYIAKPVHRSDLLRVLLKWIGT
ncbi:two-component system protein A [Aspergillus terreus]|nr:two-component system protein A [Aspergillus terreus]